MGMQANIVRDYLRKYSHIKKLNISSLARKIYGIHKDLFGTVENTRDSIRYCIGSKGEQKLKHVKDSGYTRKDEPKFKGITPSAPDIENTEDVKISFNKSLLICDIHFPFHDRKAVCMAIDMGQKEGVDSLIINGDAADFYKMSKFRKNTKAWNIKQEIQCVRKNLEALRMNFKKAKIYYKMGNHEMRYYGYIFDNAPEFSYLFDDDLDLFGYKKLFNAGLYDIDIIEPHQLIKVGKLHIIHGTEINGFRSGGKVAARLLANTISNVLCSHHHSTSNETIQALDGRVISCWSVGCLCKLSQGYSRYNPHWNHGFAIIDNTSGNFVVHNKKIINGNVY